jgi:hypothetical protein
MKTLLAVAAAMAFFISRFAFAADAVLPNNRSLFDASFSDLDQGFVIYLETPEIPTEEVRNYLEGLDQCSRGLESQDEAGAREILASLARDTRLDQDLCDELGRRIDATSAVLTQKQSVEKANGELQSSLDKPESNPDDIADALRKQSEDQRKSSPPDSSDNSPSTLLTENYLKDTQIREKIAANDRNYRLLVDQCRSDFCTYIERLAADGHYRIVSISADSYRWLFPGTIDPPEVSSAVATSQDKLSELEQVIESAQEESTRRQLVAAADQLQSAYHLGANDPQLLGVALTLKKPILAFIFQEERLRAAMLARDPDACEALLPEMTREAVDFDARPVQKFVDDIREKSRLLIRQAKSAIEQGNTSSGLEDFQKAATIWPGNPALQGGAVELVLRQEAKTAALKKFDAYWTQGDYTSLAAQSNEFAPWLEGDSTRDEALKNAQEKVRSADSAVRQATDLQAAGHAAAALETLIYALNAWPGNNRLTELRLALAPGAPNFVQAIERAEEAEKRNQLGLSLSWYAIARTYDAQSRLAREGIDRVAKKILR